jgi:hypothetical protein
MPPDSRPPSGDNGAGEKPRLTEADLLKKFNIAARWSAATPPAGKQAWLPKLAKDAFRDGGHLFLGEPHTNGNTLKAYDLLARNPELFTTAAKAGARHFVLEFPSVLQKPLDDYAAKKITRQEFHKALFTNIWRRFSTGWLAGKAEKQFRESFIDAVDNALAAGMKVHFADVTSQKYFVSEPKEFTALDRKLQAQHRREKSRVPFRKYAADYIAGLPQQEQERLRKVLDDFQLEQRALRMDDSAQHKHLRKRIPAGEAMLGLVGFAHMDDSGGGHMGINMLLEKEGAHVTTVELYDSRNTLEYIRELYALLGLKKPRQPDFTAFLDEGKLEPRAATAAKPNPPQANPPKVG